MNDNIKLTLADGRGIILKVAYLGNHMREQGVGGDVERNAQKQIGTALIELAGESP